ncbi:AbiH family protein [Parasediminibacterium sp. JCM 36343]|uniref:AbiH family protein n=1 Tax=Parasediminibacterium sp. JCM 36343 TaxID=3374279 RepID=UPI00397B1590
MAKKQVKMNRLIIIGNGFDLAHKLKTSYADFVKDYIKNVINYFYKNDSSIDPLIEITYRHSSYYINDQHEIDAENAVEVLETLQSGSRRGIVSVNIKSSFLEKTLNKINEINWVDLEDDYFKDLLACKNSKGFDFAKVKTLNDEFDFLKKKLEEYLIKVENENECPFSTEISNLFCEQIKGRDIVTLTIEDQSPNKILILNFNYTNTLEKYKEECEKSVSTEINYIHGKLGTSSNPLIFGYGDEYNKSYLEFEELKNKELLKHIKSFGYFKTTNLHDLIRFIEKDFFQVYIFGHSLGLSDRTMLKQIFEDDKCKSIKIFYHNSNKTQDDYTDKTYDISTHFSDKALMRKKIVNKPNSSPMPQPNILG